jgi:hypothetical protein
MDAGFMGGGCSVWMQTWMQKMFLNHLRLGLAGASRAFPAGSSDVDVDTLSIIGTGAYVLDRALTPVQFEAPIFDASTFRCRN